MMNANEIKNFDDVCKFYSERFNEIKEMDTTNEVKANLLNQLNRTMTNIYESLK